MKPPLVEPLTALAGFLVAGILAVGVLVDMLVGDGEPPVAEQIEHDTDGMGATGIPGSTDGGGP